MTHYCVVGGSSGLGLKIAQQLTSENNSVTILSRRPPTISLPAICRHFSIDLASLTNDFDWKSLLSYLGHVDGFFFCQRYRPATQNEDSAFLLEYNISVLATYRILTHYLQSIPPPLQSAPRVAVIGSTYSTAVGFDQSTSYHCSKHAQLALVKHLALIHTSRELLILLFSPPTFQKDGSSDYWSNTKKISLWEDTTGTIMPSVDTVATSIIDTTLSCDMLLSGNNIFLDRGFSSIYFDQTNLDL